MKSQLKARSERQKKVVRIAGEERSGAARVDLSREQRQLDALLEKDQKYWTQMSRMTWMRCGDKSTTLCHCKASARKKRNDIRCLFDDLWS